jgi:hypothetical protein
MYYGAFTQGSEGEKEYYRETKTKYECIIKEIFRVKGPDRWETLGSSVRHR